VPTIVYVAGNSNGTRGRKAAHYLDVVEKGGLKDRVLRYAIGVMGPFPLAGFSSLAFGIGDTHLSGKANTSRLARRYLRKKNFLDGRCTESQCS
jgi:hypothetical protein